MREGNARVRVYLTSHADVRGLKCVGEGARGGWGSIASGLSCS